VYLAVELVLILSHPLALEQAPYVTLTAVVTGYDELLVAVEVAQEPRQVGGAVGDVVADHERGGGLLGGQLADPVPGGGHDLHEPLRAGARYGYWAEGGLLAHDGPDEGGLHAAQGRLLHHGEGPGGRVGQAPYPQVVL